MQHPWFWERTQNDAQNGAQSSTLRRRLMPCFFHTNFKLGGRYTSVPGTFFFYVFGAGLIFVGVGADCIPWGGEDFVVAYLCVDGHADRFSPRQGLFDCFFSPRESKR